MVILLEMLMMLLMSYSKFSIILKIQIIIFLCRSSQVSVDSHPEKRMKSAYDAYELENLPKLKQEYPTLRLSQLKQLLKKQWMKAPENPFNKPTKAYNEGSNLKQNSLPEEKDSDEEEDN